VFLKITEGQRAGEELVLKCALVREKTPLAGVSTSLWQAKWIITTGFAVALEGQGVTASEAAWTAVALDSPAADLAGGSLIWPIHPEED